MGFIIEAVINWFWIGFVERKSKGKPWWVWLFWMVSPLLAFGAFIGLFWLALRSGNVR
jgi:hypothetical protein